MTDKIDETLQQITEKALTDSVVRLSSQYTAGKSRKLINRLHGSGFFVEPNLIATNIHCVAGAPPSIFAEFPHTETKFFIEGVVASDDKNDLVLLKITGEGVPLPITDSDTVQSGDTFYAVGYPRGEAGEGKQVTIHSIRKSDKCLQIKEAFDPGQSGSPLLNGMGEVIGIPAVSDLSGLKRSRFGAEKRSLQHYAIPADIGDTKPFHSYAICSNFLTALLTDIREVKSLVEWQKHPRIRGYAEAIQGQVKRAQRRNREAIACFDAALELNPDLAEIYIDRASLRRDFLNQAREAIADCDAALRLKPDFIGAYNERAMANVFLERYKETINDCDAVLKLTPDVRAYTCRAVAKSALGQYESAFADFDAGLKFNPTSVGTYLCRGNLKLQLEDYAGAIEDFDKGIALSPKDDMAYMNLGQAKRLLGDYEGAIEDCNKAIQLNPKGHIAYYNRAVATHLLGELAAKQGNVAVARRHYRTAISDYTRTLKLTPWDAITCGNRGWVKYLTGQLEAEHGHKAKAQRHYHAAIDDYMKALKLDPKHASSYNNLGWTKYLIGQFKAEQGRELEAQRLYQEALSDSNFAVRLNPHNTSYHTRGVIRAVLGDYTGAIDDFNNAIRINPLEAITYLNRGQAKEALGQMDAANADFEKAEALENRKLEEQ